MYPVGDNFKTFSFYTENSNKANALKRFLKLNEIWNEPSACGDGVYFSIRCTDAQKESIDNYLDKF